MSEYSTNQSLAPDKVVLDQWLQRLFTGETVSAPDAPLHDVYRHILEKLQQVYGQNGVEAALQVLNAYPNSGVIPVERLPNKQEPKLIYTAAEFMELPPISYLDKERMIPERSLILIYGPSQAGKSLWAKRKLAEISYEVPAMLILGEGRGGTPDRLRAEQMALGRELSSQFYIYPRAVNLGNPTAVDDFIDQVSSRKPRFFVFDTLSTCASGMDQNSTGDMTPVMDACFKILNACDATVMLVHHSTKDGEIYRGSTVLDASPDVIYVVSNDDVVTVKARKVKDDVKPDPRYFRIESYITRQRLNTGEDVTAGVLVPIDEPNLTIADQFTRNDHSVLQALDEVEEGMKWSELLVKTKLEKSSLKKAIDHLTQQGLVEHESRGPYLINEGGKQLLEEKVQKVQKPSIETRKARSKGS